MIQISKDYKPYIQHVILSVPRSVGNGDSCHRANFRRLLSLLQHCRVDKAG